MKKYINEKVDAICEQLLLIWQEYINDINLNETQIWMLYLKSCNTINNNESEFQETIRFNISLDLISLKLFSEKCDWLTKMVFGSDTYWWVMNEEWNHYNLNIFIIALLNFRRQFETDYWVEEFTDSILEQAIFRIEKIMKYSFKESDKNSLTHHYFTINALENMDDYNWKVTQSINAHFKP